MTHTQPTALQIADHLLNGEPYTIAPAAAAELRRLHAIEAALAQDETSSSMAAQEPVALVIDGVLVKSELPEKYTGHLYTTPQQRKPLTDEQIDDLARTMVKSDKSVNWLARAIEAAVG